MIPNFERYKTVVELWLDKGEDGLIGDYRKFMYRLIRQFGKRQDVLADIESNKDTIVLNITKAYNTGEHKTKLKEAMCFPLSELGLGECLLTFGEFKKTADNEYSAVRRKSLSALTDKLLEVKYGEFADEARRLDRINRSMAGNDKKKIDMQSLMSRIDEINRRLGNVT